MDMSAFMAELESRFDEERVRDLEELIDELTDAERASVTLSARLAGAVGVLTLALRGGHVVSGQVLDSTRTWVLLRGEGGDSLVMMSAVVGAWPLGRSVARESSIRGGIGVGHVLRELSARGVGVAIESDGGDHRGIIDAVYADHVDVALSGTAAMNRKKWSFRWRLRGFVDSACSASDGRPITERFPPSDARASRRIGPE